jgi:hypothetical protein
MPWSLAALTAIGVLFLIPIVQTAVAFIIVLASLPIVIPLLQLTAPVVETLMKNGIRGGPALIAVCAALVAPFAIAALGQYLRSNLTPLQKSRRLNALILVCGVPLTIGIAWWLMPGKFG